MAFEALDPSGARSWDDLTELLRRLRAHAGTSYRALHREIAEGRRRRAMAEVPSYNSVFRCFDSGRTRLDVELVVDIVRVLTGGDELTAQWRQACQVVAGTSGEAAVVRVAATLPDDLEGFVGRETELELLTSGAARVWSIQGMAGVGKSLLAIRAAHQLSPQFPDLQLSVDLRGFDPDRPPADPAAVLDGFLRRLGVPGRQIDPLDLAHRAARFQELVAGRRVLLLLDNAHSADQVRPLLPGTEASAVLITSRRRLTELPATAVDLDVFGPEESLTLLRAGLREGAAPLHLRADSGGAAESARRITDLVGRLPLALALVAGWMAGRPDWTLADQLDHLSAQRANLQLVEGVELALGLSYDALPPDLQRLLRLLALSPGQDFDVPAAAALAAVESEDATRGVIGLLAASLLQQRSSGRYELHDLVRTYAVARSYDLDPPPARRAAMTRLFDAYRYGARQAAELLLPHHADRWPILEVPRFRCAEPADRADAMAWFETERPMLVAIAQYAAAHGWSDHPSDLSSILHLLFEMSGHWADSEALHNSAVRSSTGSARGRALNRLGWTQRMRGQLPAATTSMRQALEIFATCGDTNDRAAVLNNLGGVYWLQGHYNQALDLCRQALVLQRELSAPMRIARTLRTVGIVCERLGRYDEAVAHHLEEAEISRHLGDRVAENRAMVRVGWCYQRQRKTAEATRLLTSSLDSARQLDDDLAACLALAELGRISAGQGRWERALEQHLEALALGRGRDDLWLESTLLNELGDSLRGNGRTDEALTRYDEAGRISAEIGDRFEHARATAGRAACLALLGRTSESITCHRQALEAYRELGVPASF